MDTKPRKNLPKTSASPKKPAAVKNLRNKPSAKSPTTTAPAVPIVGAVGKTKANSATNKQSQLLALLQSAHGTTMEQMMEATGWQAHSIRGCISAVFRKRLGLQVENRINASVRVYRIIAPV